MCASIWSSIYRLARPDCRLRVFEISCAHVFAISRIVFRVGKKDICFTSFNPFFFYFCLQSNPYGLKDSTGSSDMWSSASLQPSTGYYHYDSTLAAYG